MRRAIEGKSLPRGPRTVILIASAGARLYRAKPAEFGPRSLNVASILPSIAPKRGSSAGSLRKSPTIPHMFDLGFLLCAKCPSSRAKVNPQALFFLLRKHRRMCIVVGLQLHSGGLPSVNDLRWPQPLACVTSGHGIANRLETAPSCFAAARARPQEAARGRRHQFINRICGTDRTFYA